VDTVTVWSGGSRKLRKDQDFGPWASLAGPIRLAKHTEEPFFYLARVIIYQQLAGAAARTIHGRFVEALKGEVTPAKVLRVRETTLRKAGLSAAKATAVRDLASKVRSGDVAVHDLEALPNDEIVSRLTTVKGIGPWTAQMYLMFRLHRPDVWPVLDLGVRSGLTKILKRDSALGPKEMEPLGDPYRPWRSAAAFYCWRALENELP
jgi:DNA-3-methyladenine glycosylase II